MTFKANDLRVPLGTALKVGVLLIDIWPQAFAAGGGGGSWVYGESVSVFSACFDVNIFSVTQCRSHLASFQISLRGNDSMCSFIFGASVGGGKSKSFHLDDILQRP